MILFNKPNLDKIAPFLQEGEALDLFFEKEPGRNFWNLLDSYISRRGFTDKVNVRLSGNASEWTNSSFFLEMKNLKHLQVDPNDRIDLSQVKNMTQLQSFSFGRDTWQASTIDSLAIENLKLKSMAISCPLNDFRFLKGQKSLKVLSVGGNTLDAAFFSSLPSSLVALLISSSVIRGKIKLDENKLKIKLLDLAYVALEESDLQWVTEMNELEILNLQSIESIHSLPKLTSNNINRISLLKLGEVDISSIAHSPEIRELALHYTDLNDVSIEAIKSLGKLERCGVVPNGTLTGLVEFLTSRGVLLDSRMSESLQVRRNELLNI